MLDHLTTDEAVGEFTRRARPLIDRGDFDGLRHQFAYWWMAAQMRKWRDSSYARHEMRQALANVLDGLVPKSRPNRFNDLDDFGFLNLRRE